MDFSAVKDKIIKQAEKASPLGGKFKLVLDDNYIFIDGTGEKNQVFFEDKEADTTITTSIQAMLDMVEGKLNPMMAVMTSKVKIKGDMGLAMKLQSLI